MVARINTGENISKVLYYNEHKVRRNEADIIHAHNFLKDADQLSFSDKMRWFEKFTALNDRTKTNSLHVSLNFDPSEKLNNRQLVEIARVYMEKIGFSEQPYLVYRHSDAGHPHIHIVSTNIRSDGSRISMHNLGRNQSERARRAIEIDFGLVKAQGKQLDDAVKLIPISAQKVALGKASVKRAISNVLGLVINHYKYASLPEMNAVLKLYNVVADRGEKGTVMYETGGLVFRVLDEKGNKISPPIKASSFWMKPTLKNLQERFNENEKLKQPHAKRLRSAVDYSLLKKPGEGLKSLIAELNKEKISVVLRQNKQGVIYGITYVDHQTKAVFNGSDLGKAYSAKMILERTSALAEGMAVSPASEKKSTLASEFDSKESQALQSQGDELKLPEVLPSPEKTFDFVPYQLKKKRKKKKKQLKQ